MICTGSTGVAAAALAPRAAPGPYRCGFGGDRARRRAAGVDEWPAVWADLVRVARSCRWARSGGRRRGAAGRGTGGRGGGVQCELEGSGCPGDEEGHCLQRGDDEERTEHCDVVVV